MVGHQNKALARAVSLSRRAECLHLCSGWRLLGLAVMLGLALGAGSCRPRGVYPPASAVGVGQVTPDRPVRETPRPVTRRAWFRQELTAEGVGVAPAHATNAAQRRQLARRFAITEARRQLAVKLAAVQVNAEVRIQDLMAQSDQVRLSCRALVMGAEVVREVIAPDGECQVVVSAGLQILRQAVEGALEPERGREERRPPAQGENAETRALRLATIDAQQKLVAAIYREYVDRQLTSNTYQLVVRRINEQGALRGAEIKERSYNPRTGEAKVKVRLNGLQVERLVDLMRSMR